VIFGSWISRLVSAISSSTRSMSCHRPFSSSSVGLNPGPTSGTMSAGRIRALATPVWSAAAAAPPPTSSERRGTADVGRAKADDAAGEADEAQGDPPLGGNLVLGVEEQGVIVAALLPQPHRVLPKRPVETAAALRRQVIAEIFMLDDGFVDDEVEALDVGKLLLRDSGKLIAVLDDGELSAARGLLGAQGGDDVGARFLGPFGARLDHPASRQRPYRDVGAKHEEPVIALRRRELDVGELPGLDAAAERDRSCQRQRDSRFPHSPLPRENSLSCSNDRRMNSACF